MPITITPGTAQLLTSRGREKVLQGSGVPNGLAKLAALMTPDPTTPYAFGALRLMDVPAKKAGLLARARIAQVLADLGFHDSGRIWQFLERHPRLVRLRTVSQLPKPPGTIGMPLGETTIPPAVEEPIRVLVSRRSPDRGATMAHELVTAATGLAGKSTEPLPGLAPSYLGTMRLSQYYDPKVIPSEYLPTLFDRPEWITLIDRQKALEGLGDWFSQLPRPPRVTP